MNKLTLLSTLLELIGLTLAFLDMRLPTQMKKLEDVIDQAGEDLTSFASSNAEKGWYQAVLTISLLFLFIVGFGWVIGMHFAFIWYVGFWLSAAAGLSIIIVAILGDFIALLNRFSIYDQAVTTLGFFLASSGMVIELLQLFGIV